MADQTAVTCFNNIYDDTYQKSLRYVTKKCCHAEDIADILQEIYTEVYLVIAKKGIEYVHNPEAFVMQVTKSKVYKHYSLAEKLKNLIPLFVTSADDEEVNIADFELPNDSIEEHLINSLLLDEVAKFIAAKPSDVQKVFFMYYYLDLTISQIASDLSMKESTVKSKIYRTVREVRILYGKDGAQDE